MILIQVHYWIREGLSPEMTPQAPPINPDRNSFIYFQVKEALEDEVIGGKYLVGDRLPPIPELADKFSVSISTIRRALRV